MKIGAKLGPKYVLLHNGRTNLLKESIEDVVITNIVKRRTQILYEAKVIVKDDMYSPYYIQFTNIDLKIEMDYFIG